MPNLNVLERDTEESPLCYEIMMDLLSNPQKCQEWAGCGHGGRDWFGVQHICSF